MNAILWHCGRSTIKAKLADPEDRFGFTSIEASPACSSQICNTYGYASAGNCRSKFRCL